MTDAAGSLGSRDSERTAAQRRILVEVARGPRVYSRRHEPAITMLERAGLVEVDRDWSPAVDGGCRLTVWPANCEMAGAGVDAVPGDVAPPMTPADARSFPVPRPGWVLDPTTSMQVGRQQVNQCAWCGTVVIVAPIRDEDALRSLAHKPCPTCDQTEHGWWRQEVPVTHSLAGFRFVGSDAA